MGLTRAIGYCESLRLDAPAVVAGWIRPVVLLPVSALSGLTQAQLEAVIAHELAHIRRYDTLVNLFQVAVETLLFYHPAVWWLGSRLRAEREHCCDDAAVELCGSPVTYAHALTRMAESKSAPQLAMAVNRSPLVERIARLLGADNKAESLRGANLIGGRSVFIGGAFGRKRRAGSVHQMQAQTPAPARAAETDALVQRRRTVSGTCRSNTRSAGPYAGWRCESGAGYNSRARGQARTVCGCDSQACAGSGGSVAFLMVVCFGNGTRLRRVDCSVFGRVDGRYFFPGKSGSRCGTGSG